MDFSNTDPMFGSAVYRDVISPHQSTFQSSNGNRCIGVMDFDSYSRPTMMEPHDMDFTVDSPTSESYCESDDATSIMGIQDSVSSPSDIHIDNVDVKNNVVVRCGEEYTDSKFVMDKTLIMKRWGPHDVFPADKSWTLEQKAAKLIQLSPCKKYTVSDLLNLDQVEKPEFRVEILIDLVCNISVNFRWNYVKPHELFKSYTVVTNCKKDKGKKDAEGKTIPKRPMNAFMIWCQKCRTLMAHICPQLHNAIISKALGAKWKTFTPEERAVYEDEKIKLMSFHQFEFPDYKYRPKKKPKKSDEKPTPAPKSRSKKKNTDKPQPAPLRAINIADEARQNLDPLLKERLQVKMQVKIDPDLKRGIGKRATAIDLADLTGFQADFASSPEGAHTIHQHQFMDSQTSSVFDTPENSPHEPRTPSDFEQSPIYPKEAAFCFDEKVSLNLDNNNTVTTVNNNLNIVTHLNDIWPTTYIKSEPISPNAQPLSGGPTVFQPTELVKSEPLMDYPLWNNNNVERELQNIDSSEGAPPFLPGSVVEHYFMHANEGPGLDIDECLRHISTDESSSLFFADNNLS